MKYNKNKEFSEIKKNPSQGKRISAVRRAENMVWTAAGVYDFEPQFLSFWQDGTPDFYTNSIIGYAHKWYFTTAMQTLFSTINDSLHRDLYDGLLWFVLENCTFEREVSARPALNEMRYSYAKKFLDQESSRSRQQWMAQNSTVYALQAARCHTILGQDTGLVSTKEKKLFNELTLSGSATDQEIIHRVTSVFQQYFHYSGQPDRLTFLYRCSMRLKRKLLNPFPYVLSEMTDFSLNLVLHQPLEEKEPAEPVLTLTGQRMPLKKIMNISANALAAPSTRKKKNAA